MPLKLSDERLETFWAKAQAAKRAFSETRTESGAATVSRKDRVERDRCLLRGDHYNPALYPNGNPFREFIEVPIGLIGSNAQIVIANLLHSLPQFTVEPKAQGYVDEETGQEIAFDPETKKRLPLLLERWLTQYYVSSGAQTAFRNVLLDGLAGGGVGILHASWYEGDDDPTLPMDPSEAARLQELAQTPGVRARDLRPAYTVAGRGPVALYVSPHDFLVDPQATWDRIEEAAFMGRMFPMPKERIERVFPEWAKRNNLDRVIQDGVEFNTNPIRQHVDSEDNPEDVLVFDLWFKSVYIERDFTQEDAEGNIEQYPGGYEYPVRVVWAQDRPLDPLRVELWPLDYRNDRDERLYPFLFIIPNPQPDSFWGQSDAELQEAMQRLMNFALSALVTHAKSYAKTRHTYTQNALTDEGYRTLLHGGPDSFVECTPNAGENPIRPVERIPPDPSILQVMETAKRFMDVISGVDEPSQGITAQGEQTATEANLLASKSSSRMALKQADYEGLVETLAGMFYQAMVKYGLIGDKIRLTLPQAQGGTGEPEDVEIGPEHLVPAKVTVETGSTMAANKQQKINNTLAFTQTAAQMGALQPMNPAGFYDSQVLLDRLAALMDVDDGSGALRDISKYEQQMMMAQQMQQQQAMMAQQQQQQDQEAGRAHEMALAQVKTGQGQPPAEEPLPDPNEDPQATYAALTPEERDQLHERVLQGLNGQNGGPSA